MSKKSNKIKSDWLERQNLIRSPFTRQKKGAFQLVLPNGRVMKFKDAEHRAFACEKLSRNRFNSIGEMVTFLKALPNGFTSFVENFSARKEFSPAAIR